MNLQQKSDEYWEKTIDAENRRIVYFDEYFDEETRKKSFAYRINILLNQKSAVNSYLDVGCGHGAFLYELFSQNNNLELAGLDISQDAIDFCIEKIPSAKLVNDTFANINNHFGENSYDVVFTSGVMLCQSPETLGSTIDDLIKIGKKYIIHFEDEGSGELRSDTRCIAWKHNLRSAYTERGYNFYFGAVPLEAQVIGFTSYVVVDLLNSNDS